jgi:hypothetical protein
VICNILLGNQWERRRRIRPVKVVTIRTKKVKVISNILLGNQWERRRRIKACEGRDSRKPFKNLWNQM